MASLAMDNASPPVFFGDRGDLAWAIGAPIRNEEAAQKAVQEVLKELRKDGAIVWSGQGRAGVKAAYALALEFDHTWTPSGAGRNIQWHKVSRPDVPAGMRGKDSEYLLRKIQQEKAQTPEISPPKTEEISESQPPEISPDSLRKSLTPTTRDSNPYLNSSIQSGSSVTREPTLVSELIETSKPRSMEDERLRQSRLLKQRFPELEEEVAS